MEFRTIVDIPKPGFEMAPCEEVLLVGSCFANEVGQRFREEGFPVTVNPYGTMYNPVSVLHTVERLMSAGSNLQSAGSFQTVFLTLGTNHVYREKATGEIVDNCEKRPAALFQEEVLSMDECADYLQRTVALLRSANPTVRIVFTVSPIRYRKYGYHESQLSKATLLLAIDKLLHSPFDGKSPKAAADSSLSTLHSSLYYFPVFEVFMDELRDYRFYAADMLHPSEQAVDYVWERLVETFFSSQAKAFLEEWRPLKQALAHRPFNPDSAAYKALMDKTMLKVTELRKKYPTFAL